MWARIFCCFKPKERRVTPVEVIAVGDVLEAGTETSEPHIIRVQGDGRAEVMRRGYTEEWLSQYESRESLDDILAQVGVRRVNSINDRVTPLQEKKSRRNEYLDSLKDLPERETQQYRELTDLSKRAVKKVLECWPQFKLCQLELHDFFLNLQKPGTEKNRMELFCKLDTDFSVMKSFMSSWMDMAERGIYKNLSFLFYLANKIAPENPILLDVLKPFEKLVATCGVSLEEQDNSFIKKIQNEILLNSRVRASGDAFLEYICKLLGNFVIEKNQFSCSDEKIKSFIGRFILSYPESLKQYNAELHKLLTDYRHKFEKTSLFPEFFEKNKATICALVYLYFTRREDEAGQIEKELDTMKNDFFKDYAECFHGEDFMEVDVEGVISKSHAMHEIFMRSPSFWTLN